jgi:acid phosphatase
VPRAAAAGTALALLVLAGCGRPASRAASLWTGCARHGSAVAAPCAPDTGPAGATAAPPSGLPAFRHVVILVFAGQRPGPVAGNPAAPYFTALARMGANFTNSRGVAVPGQADYLALLSGSTQGVTSDSCPGAFLTPNLGGDLIAADETFTGYAGSLAAAGAAACSPGNDARARIPWSDFSDVPASATRPLASFPRAATADFGALPDVSVVSPAPCASARPCTLAVQDAWLAAHMSGYVRYAMRHDSLLIVTFTDGGGAAGSVVPTIFVGDHVRPGTTGQRINHYNVLRTVEDMFGLPHDGAAAAAAPVTGIWLPPGP